MVEFNELRKLKYITAMLVFVKYSLWCLFFILQGKAIDLAIEKNRLYTQLIYTLAGYVSIKMIVMLCDIFQKFIIEFYKNLELKQQWNQNFPQDIYRDNASNQHQLNSVFFDYLPKLFEVEISIVTNQVILGYISFLTIAAFLYTGFIVGIFALLLVFVLNYLSKNIFTKQIDQYQVEASASKIKTLNWVSQYFSAYREISKNWRNLARLPWKDDVYRQYFTAKNKQSIFYLYRDLLSQALVELPFLLNTSIVIMAVYYKYLSLTQLFVWVGFSQFMINASNAYLENKLHKKQCIMLNRQARHVLSSFNDKSSEETTKIPIYTPLFAKVNLRDGTKNYLSLLPGLYTIKGGNGSGKSTLMNIILSYERKHRHFENINLSPLTAALEKNNIRVIERDAIIFECFADFDSQVCGPLLTEGWMQLINRSLTQLLPPRLAKKWVEIFISLEAKYLYRNDQSMSSGEKIILSLMRFFSSWNSQVNLLIVDECDSFLDQDKKRLFIETIKHLASHMAVYMSSHGAWASANK